MKRAKLRLLTLSAPFLSAVSAFAGVLVETSAPSAPFRFETLTPRAITSSGAVSLPCAAGATVSVASPAGKGGTLAAGVEAYAWTPDEGGLWTLSSSADGTATFTVRYSFFPGTEGAGTEASPLKIVDGEELADLVAGGRAGNGTVFTLCGDDGLMSLLERPAGYAIVAKADGKYMLDSSDPRLVAGISSPEFVLDLETEGPNRRGKKSHPWPDIAYTGDGWARDSTAASTLTLTPPGGTAATAAHTGTGTVPFAPRMAGIWNVALAYGSTTLTGQIEVVPEATVMILR